MRIETVAVFALWDLDYEKKEIRGLNLSLLSAVDRIELDNGKLIPIEKKLFAQENWFDQIAEMAKR